MDKTGVQSSVTYDSTLLLLPVSDYIISLTLQAAASDAFDYSFLV